MSHADFEYAPSLVYTNLVKLFNYRQSALETKPLSQSEVVVRLNQYEYAILEGIREPDPNRGITSAEVKVVLLAPGSKYATTSAEFKKLLKRFVPGKRPLEILVVSSEPLTVHIKKLILEIEYLIEDYTYAIFKCEIPKHVEVPPHIIMTLNEIEECCEHLHTDKIKFSKILSTDPMAIWLGIRPGMVCKIMRLSETAGQAPAMRYCVK